MGDFNAKHIDFNCNTTNTSGRVLRDILDSTNLAILNTNEPTHIHSANSTADILDLVLCSPDLAAKLLSFSVSHDVGSDHLPVLASFSLQLQQAPEKQRYNYKKADWDKYRNCITDNITNIAVPTQNPKDLDQLAERIGSILIQAREETIPLTTTRPPQQLPPHILSLIKQKRKIRRDFIRTRAPNLQKQWTAFYHQLDTDTNPQTFWQKIKTINGDKSNNIIPVLKSQNQLIEDNKTKATLFRNHLQNVHSCPDDPLFDKDWKTIVDREMQKTVYTSNPTPVDHPLTRSASIEEIKTHLKKTKNKAPGEDNIDSTLIKQAPDEYLHLLSNLFTACLTEGYFPLPWKSAVVTMIHKPGKDPYNVTSYRPISLLSHVGKLFERVLTQRLSGHTEEMGLLGIHQAGFRKARSTTDNILRLSEDILRNFKKKSLTLAVFFDIEKAFDKMWHNGLCYRLADSNLKLPLSIRNIITSFLHNRTIKVKVSTAISSPFTPEAGVPQGAVLSPLLFLLYISDIYYPPPTVEQVSQFADDLCYWSSSKCPQLAAKKLQKSIEMIESWSNMWRVKLNPQKTQCVLFTKSTGKKTRKPIDLKLYGETIKVGKEAKFLGVTFQKNMSWTTHIANIEREGRKRLNHLKTLCGRKYGASPQTVLKVYTSYIRPLFEYALPAWITASPQQMNRLQTVQNMAAKMAYRLPRYISNHYVNSISGLTSINNRQSVIGQKFINRATHNPSLKEAVGQAKWTTDTPMSIMLKLT
ncbi:probable RNA-directed DNA polymerase from transposon BS [Oncorhynchus nerka]|uniref:probable RNA-directed DNA polymerase from transposon BS n=1 Tax=Oncorhynchus nerka TaxID=8023 RepID=UPI0031B86C40